MASFFQIQLLSVSAGSSVSTTGVYGPPCLNLGGGPSGTAQVTISGNFDGIRANLIAGAAKSMPL